MGRELVQQCALGVTIAHFSRAVCHSKRQPRQHLGSLTTFLKKMLKKKTPTCSMMLILCSTEQFNCKLLKAKEECVLLKFSKPVNIFTLVSRALYQRIATQHLHTYSVYATHPHTTVKEKDHLHRRVKINVFSLTSIHKTVIIWANLHCWCCQVEQGSLITSVRHASHEKW